VSANAGSGKTHVLTQRVVRLLLRDIPPSKILCLTFTKAAAANMAERVFGTLALWTRLPDDELCRSILATGAPEPSRADLVAARKLFARTVETPGGLKIQTIHAFCEKLLHHFPFEANVPSRFEVADERRERELLSRARREVLSEAATSGGKLGAALARVSDECGAENFEALIREALTLPLRARFRAAGLEDPDPALREVLGLAEGRTEADITREMVEGGLSPARQAEIAVILEGGTKTDRVRAALLRNVSAALRSGAAQDGALLDYLAAYFIDGGDGTRAAKLLTKGLAEARPDILADLLAEQERLERLREERKAAAACGRTAALATLVGAVLGRYEAMKALRGVLDFDDLIEKTSVLLERSDAAWVLYKLDAGIDHVLVDEAQDTSEAQWRILGRLTEDFSAGTQLRRAQKTFFAVGDEKQSIFSFQGAAPHMFAEMRRRFETRFQAGGMPFAQVSLTQSFRSVPGVLAAVDSVFAAPAHQKGLVADDIWMGHEALKARIPGLVEIWPAIGTEPSEPRADWRLPLDYADETDPPSRVASRVAAKIAQLLAEESLDRVHESGPRSARRIGAGDIMVLVRTRGPFFEAVIRALKASKVPVAGADRLVLARHIAVMDLVAAGRAALLPDDDLTLAAVLKSPLMGLDDEDLLAIAPDRVGSLFDALLASPDPRHRRAAERLDVWRERAALGPYAFYARLLGEDGGRRALERRLGPEACDAIDEFLRLALAQDSELAPSLVGFLAEVEAMDGSIKRDMESGADCVRVMTVHAAKGLEAKIVFLPDTCGVPSPRHDPRIFALGSDGPIVWSPGTKADTGAITAARKEARQAAEEEYRRLLYVALTRAEERVYIAGFYGEREPGEISWSAMIERTLSGLDGMEEISAFWDPKETISRFVSDGGPLGEVVAEPRGETVSRAGQEIPAWLTEPAAPEPAPPPAVHPSSFVLSRVPSAAMRTSSLEAGLLAHRLLQQLPSFPREARRKAALDLLDVHRLGGTDASSSGADASAAVMPGLEPGIQAIGVRDWMAGSSPAMTLSETQRRNMIEAVLGVIEMPELADLFGPGSRAEVSVAGRVLLPRGARVEVSGRVDRIAVTQTEVLVADFKTGRVPERLPAAYLTQLALYRAALAPLFPRMRVRMLLVWTSGPAVTWLDDHSLDESLAAFEPNPAIPCDPT